jgi:uncharacterized protein YcbK (DUF882 family)
MRLLKHEERQLCLGLNHEEFRCKCQHPSCTSTPIRKELIEAYEKLRKKLNIPLKITSGYRCPLHNFGLLGSSKKSAHMCGLAIDVGYVGELSKLSIDEVIREIQGAGFHMSYYSASGNFFHMQINDYSLK